MPVATTPLPVDLVGLVVDNGRSQFVELLGVGAYGSVYLAYDLLSPPNYPVYFAAKVMVKAPPKSRQRAFQRREIDLHTNASPHPNVVTVHKVLDEQGYYILIMDYYPDGDLFSMVTDNQFYLGKDDLTKSVFLQIIDAVIYCHSLGIYHRDIKPENILCLDGGRTVALADFGLATTDELSNDFGAGSSYYMSPECLDESAPQVPSYSTKSNDIWALGVILLNLTCGRNPWKSAHFSDPTFSSFLRDNNFLPSILPISKEVNDILRKVFSIDPKKRMGLREFRDKVQKTKRFTMTENEMGRAKKAAREAGWDILEAKRRRGVNSQIFDLDTPPSKFSDSSLESLSRSSASPSPVPSHTFSTPLSSSFPSTPHFPPTMHNHPYYGAQLQVEPPTFQLPQLHRTPKEFLKSGPKHWFRKNQAVIQV